MKKLLLLTIALFTLSGAWADYQKLYVIGNGTTNGWKPTAMDEMAYDDGTQTYTYEYNPTNEKNYFAIADLQQTSEDWTDFNTNHRYSIGSGNKSATIGTEYTLSKNGDSNIILPAGKYILTIHEMKLTITYAPGPKTASFKNSCGWATVYAYAWKNTNDRLTAEWPGDELILDGDVYTWSTTDEPEYIIFNNGGSGSANQTADLTFANGKTYDYLPANVGYYIAGTMNGWKMDTGYKMTKNDEADTDEYYILAMPLESTSQFKVVYSEDGVDIKTWYPEGTNYNADDKSITETGTYDIYFRPNKDGGDDWYEKYIYVAQEISIDITKNLWASYSSTKALDFSNSGLTAYIATTRNGSSVHYEPVTYVPANTGIILNGTQGTHVAVTIPSAEAVGTNLLVSTANAEHEVTAGEVGKVYAFGMMGGKVGFVQAEAGYTVTQGKSYLYLSTVGAKGIDFIGLPGSETDGIDTIHNAQFIMHNDAYNLAGQKVSKDYKGIVIVNGKKYLNK